MLNSTNFKLLKLLMEISVNIFQDQIYVKYNLISYIVTFNYTVFQISLKMKQNNVAFQKDQDNNYVIEIKQL